MDTAWEGEGEMNQESSIDIYTACMFSHFSHVRLFGTPRTVAYQAPLSMGVPGKKPGVDCHALLQGIFPTQGSNPCLLHCRQIPYH